jgi:ankyrin repeat protein
MRRLLYSNQVSKPSRLAGDAVLLSFLLSGTLFLYGETSAPSLFGDLRQGEIAKVKAAIDSGADVNSRDAYGNTLLMQAAVYAGAADLGFLLSHGASVNAANDAGHTALMRAMPDLAKIQLLVEHGANVKAATVDGTTPLMLAARLESATDVVSYLLKHGADAGAIDRSGSDAVMIAATEGAAGNLKILLEAGASGSSQRKNGAFPRQFAQTVNRSVIDRAVRAREGSTALMGAAMADCEACVRLLLARGADSKAKTGSGLTALHNAAYEGNPAVVKLLLDAGAPVNGGDERGFTPLMMAANSKTKDPEVVRMLLKSGADPGPKDGTGRTAAEWARIGGRREIMEVLPAQAAAGPAGAIRIVDESKPVSKDISAAIERSIALLSQTAPEFFGESGCISCHNVSIPMMALTDARLRGYQVDSKATQQMVKSTVEVPSPHRDNLLSGNCSIPGMHITSGYAAISIQGEGYQPNLFTDSIVRCLMADQQPDGEWRSGGTRPPLDPERAIPTTALSAQTVKLYTPPALARAADRSVARAREYLLTVKPWSGDDYAYRLLGLFWTGSPSSGIDAAARELVAQQRPDGGWAQTPDRDSDAYATGLALAALAKTGGKSANAPAYRRGVDYLLRSQEADGSWHVQSRAFGIQPYFESGFPHGHDQWISMAATAWSAMALMPAAEVPKTAAR